MKLIGPFIVLVGIAGLSFALYDFFTLDFFEMPHYSWLPFVSMPLIFVGFVLTGVAYRKKIQKLNEDILRDQMKAVGQGLKEGFSESGHFCSACGHQAERTAKYCSECGKELKF
ncbi:zinc-ribbon domain-containing protein [Psychrobacillus sp. L4]|uniref:zinc-ribbon domain-containing protein n=1 Tax=Psychrobacillus sp. L4 TaxID=3236892 RepID=UPI0036F21325